MAQIRLDDRDLQILAILSREGRISKADLARRIALSPTPCWERLKRLEAAGIITAYRAEIALARIGPSISVFVMAELENHRAETFQTFEKTIGRTREIVSCWALGGGYDYLLMAVTRDIDAYQRLMDRLLDLRCGLARYYSYIVTKPVKLNEMADLATLFPTDADD